MKKRVISALLSALPLVSAAGEEQAFEAFEAGIMVFGGFIVGVICFVLLIMLWIHLRKKKKAKGGGGETVDEYKIPAQQPASV